MKAKILDVEALRAISPMALSAFARSEGWSRTESYGAHADVYAGPDHPEVILPRTDQLADYAAVMSRLIGVFAAHTGRDELAIYRDLVGADRDVVRVRAVGTSDDGSIPLDAGVRSSKRLGTCFSQPPAPSMRLNRSTAPERTDRRLSI
ncbi:hypothetical protein ACFQ4K_22325 [Tistrella bauzanensis]